MPDLERIQDDIEMLLTAVIHAYFLRLQMINARGNNPLFAPASAADRLLALETVRRELQAQLRNAHQLTAVLGNGGGPLDDAQREIVLNQIAAQETYLNGFMADLPNLSEAAATHRAAQYAVPAIQTYSLVAAGQMPRLPNYPGDGQTRCNGFCKCWLEIDRVGESDWDVYWHLTAQESCPDCIALAKAWTPLQIRDGVVMSEQRSVA